MPDSSLLGRALVLGAVFGMRSMLGLALLAWFGGPGLGFLGAWWARGLTLLAASGELVGDKLPKTPSRLAPGPLGARVVLGAVCGALIFVRVRAPWWPGAALGAVSAVGGAIAGNRLRGLLVRRTGWPDFVFAVLEDGAAIVLGVWAVL